MSRGFSVPGRRYGGPPEPSGKLWPNGELTLGYAPAGGLERADTVQEWADKVCSPLAWQCCATLTEDTREREKMRRGQAGLTSYGRRLLRNAVWFMQRRHTKGRLAFVTLTLPPMGYEEAWNVSSNWAQIVRVFYQRLGRFLERRGLPPQYAGCTELQPLRTATEEIPALHLHFVVVTKRRSERAWAVRPVEIREIWAAVVSPYLYGEKDWEACENVQAVRKDAGRYMSKYMAKGASWAKPVHHDSTGWTLPTAWYNISLVVKRWVKAAVRTDSELMLWIEGVWRAGLLGEFCHSWIDGSIEECAGPGPHWLCAVLKGEHVSSIIELWRLSRGNGTLREICQT